MILTLTRGLGDYIIFRKIFRALSYVLINTKNNCSMLTVKLNGLKRLKVANKTLATHR